MLILPRTRGRAGGYAPQMPSMPSEPRANESNMTNATILECPWCWATIKPKYLKCQSCGLEFQGEECEIASVRKLKKIKTASLGPEEIDDLQMRLADAEGEQRLLQARNAEYQNKIAAVEKTYAELRQRIAEKDVTLGAKAAEIKTLADASQQLTEKYFQLQVSERQKAIAHDNLYRQHEQLQSNMRALQEKFNLQETEGLKHTERLNQKIRKQNEENESLWKDKAGLQGRVSKLESELRVHGIYSALGSKAAKNIVAGTGGIVIFSLVGFLANTYSAFSNTNPILILSAAMMASGLSGYAIWRGMA